VSLAGSVLHRFSRGGRRRFAGSPRMARRRRPPVRGWRWRRRPICRVSGGRSLCPEEALEVSGEAVYALFGSLRASPLRMIGLPMQEDRQKEWKLRNVTDGSGWQTGASGLLPSGVLLTFQFARTSMLASSPIRVRDEQWAWMDGRWVLADMSKSSDFVHILSKADELSAQLTTFAEDLRRRSGLLVSQTLRQEVYQLLLRFTTVRARFVADVEAGLGIPGLRDLHPEFAIIGRIYASECAFLPGFLKSVEDQLDTEGITQRQDCARGLLLEGFLVRRSGLHLRPPGKARCRWPRIRSMTPRRRPLVRARRDLFLHMRWFRLRRLPPPRCWRRRWPALPLVRPFLPRIR
jgi:hypothetical protein